jgi:outer membrane protein assembly factor BamA
MALVTLLPAVLFAQQEELDYSAHSGLPEALPDIRDEEAPLKVQKGDFVVVPIPMSNPTFGTGLILGGAYFYPQTEEQKKAQPASLTGGGGAYTDNGSYAVALVQQSYWNENRWRLQAVAGYLDFSLDLTTPDTEGGTSQAAWGIDGGLAQVKISRRFGDSHWYGGVLARYMRIDQNIDVSITQEDFEVGGPLDVVGLGAVFEYDTRDNTFNARKGHYAKLDAVFSRTSGVGEDDDYAAYSASFRSFHGFTDELTLAWEVRACEREGNVPLWNACFISLRGFSATEYIGLRSASAQAELRWQMSPRWGLVGFGGMGYAGTSLAEAGDSQNTPSYGAGIRFMVLKSQRINIRVDFAKSENDEAMHLSVGEAF